MYTPLNPTFVYLFFLFLLQNIDCGYSLEPPRRGGSNVYPRSMFWSKNKKKYERFSTFFFQFLLLKTSLYIAWANYRYAYSPLSLSLSGEDRKNVGKRSIPITLKQNSILMIREGAFSVLIFAGYLFVSF